MMSMVFSGDSPFFFVHGWCTEAEKGGKGRRMPGRAENWPGATSPARTARLNSGDEERRMARKHENYSPSFIESINAVAGRWKRWESRSDFQAAFGRRPFPRPPFTPRPPEPSRLVPASPLKASSSCVLFGRTPILRPQKIGRAHV